MAEKHLTGKSVSTQMKSLRNGFVKKFGAQPLGFLIGPREYTALLNSINTNDGKFTELGKFDGLPVRLKKVSGIALELPVSVLPYYLGEKTI